MKWWDEIDGFYYDVLRLPDGRNQQIKIRSMVGLIPLFGVEILEPDIVDALPGFKRRMMWFIENRPEFRRQVVSTTLPLRPAAPVHCGSRTVAPRLAIHVG